MAGETGRARLTAGRVTDFACPIGKSQAFLWDTEAPALAVRVTPTGRKTFVFEARLRGHTLRVNIGTVTDWPLEKARGEAKRLKMIVDSGSDPREIARERHAELARINAHEAAAEVAAVAAAKTKSLTVGEVWAVYLEARRERWGATHFNDHVRLARRGGELAKRGTRGRGKTIDMPLSPLMSLRLCDLDSPTIETWATRESKTRPSSARLAWRLLKVFLNWCAEQPQYQPLLPSKNAAATRKAREAFGRSKPKQDALLREQLPAWFAAVRQLDNPVISAHLQTMLLTGARPNEALTVKLADVNTKWRGITIRDKVEGDRVIPLTPYVAHLFAGLPKRNEWVFASVRAVSMDDKNVRRRGRRAHQNGESFKDGELVQASASGHITVPGSIHSRACNVAGVDHVTLHGLRRSFKSLTEWLDIPAGVVAQIMGHKPSATAEKHYTVRPLDLLRVHHERIEAWILEQAGIVFDSTADQARSQAVA